MLKIAIVTIFYVHRNMHLLFQNFKINISFSYFYFISKFQIKKLFFKLDYYFTIHHISNFFKYLKWLIQKKLIEDQNQSIKTKCQIQMFYYL
jgi:hypothetical protein